MIQICQELNKRVGMLHKDILIESYQLGSNETRRNRNRRNFRA